MIPSRPKNTAPNQKTTVKKTTEKPDSTITTKPKDNNRVSKAAPSKESYITKAIEARRAKDARLQDRFQADTERQEKLLRRGPSGPPIYDTQGFELDYTKVLKSQRRPQGARRRSSAAYKKMIEKERAEAREIEQIIGLPENGLVDTLHSAVQDRVARDLNLPFHKVQILQYRQWKEAGFKADPEEFKLVNISEEERERLVELSTGSAFRK
ncbi:hypothetical protein EPUS_00694 [Endocarpon pusillum Z07020]|uniref:Uncharacterized protein n=1 Tax=Endocarpon pusillum (strain Z07020 / HMAS-L-300199) TaxID=1263415 RepID=U1HYI1_ENDPU|nr:uncharacterized protein EPUS_00694 [Endocarpon pusillum Z07020]ERF74564.1 hypothetical protein EPUS_00694 [Endocarpon pusillum Z07020]